MSDIVGTNEEIKLLIHFIKKTLFFRSYNELGNLPGYGFFHYTVNHSENFVDPDTGKIYTLGIFFKNPCHLCLGGFNIIKIQRKCILQYFNAVLYAKEPSVSY